MTWLEPWKSEDPWAAVDRAHEAWLRASEEAGRDPSKVDAASAANQRWLAAVDRIS